jgi:hypothetical protein
MLILFKEKFSKIWPALILVVVVFFVFIAWDYLPKSETKAATAEGESLEIGLFDANENGVMDAVAIAISNPHHETWTIGEAAAASFEVTQNGAPLTVDSIIFNGDANADPVTLNLFLSETGRETDYNTDGVNYNKVEVVYNQTDDCDSSEAICGESVELNAIALGDADGSINTEVDLAKPVVVSTFPADGAAYVGLSTNIMIDFSESMDDESFDGDFVPDIGMTAPPAWSRNNTRITFAHADLAFDTDYEGSIIDGNDNADTPNDLDVPFSFSFHTMPTAPVEGESLIVALFDVNKNGVMDGVAIGINNPDDETWEIGADAADSFDVRQNGESLTISSVVINGDANADPVQLNLLLSETGRDTDYNTDGVIENPIEVVYTPTGDCDGDEAVCDSDTELNAIVDGDAYGYRNTEVDYADPQAIEYFYSDENGDGRVDRFTVGFSENVRSDDDAMLVDDFGSENGCMDVLSFDNSSISGNIIYLDISVKEDDYFTGCEVGHEPYIHYEGRLNVITDFSTETDEDPLYLKAFSLELSDKAKPVVFAIIDENQETTPDGDAETFTLFFTESIDDSTLVLSQFKFDNDTENNGIGEELASRGNTAVYVESLGDDFNLPDSNDVAYTLTLTNGIAGTEEAYLHYLGDSLTDLHGNYMIAGDNLGLYHIDAAVPVVISTEPNDGKNNTSPTADFVVTFSESMDSDSLMGNFVPEIPSIIVTWADDNTVMNFAHDRLPIDTDYVGTITAGTDDAVFDPIPDFEPNDLVVPYAFSFHTRASNSGGGGYTATPLNTSVVINNNDAQTASRDVTLKFTGTDVTEIMISNDSSFGGASWQTFNFTTKNWTLKDGYGLKTVYAKFRSAANIEVSANDSIDYEQTVTTPTTTIPPQQTSEGGAGKNAGQNFYTTMGTLEPGDLVRCYLCSTVYYYGYDGLRHSFPSELVYRSWYPDFSDILTISAMELSNLPLGRNVTMKPGTWLVKRPDDAKVYAVEPGGILRWLATEDLARRLYGENYNQLVADVAPNFWSDYQLGADWTFNVYPAGSLFRYADQPQIYYVEGLNKRWFETESAFNANLFNPRFIFTASSEIIMQSGVNINSSEVNLKKIY